MANINLLPWRDAHRQEKKKEFLGLLGVVVVIAAISAFGWNLVANNRLDNQHSRNQLLKNNIATLEKQVAEIKELKKRRQDLLDRMAVIQNLQGTVRISLKFTTSLYELFPMAFTLQKWSAKGMRFPCRALQSLTTGSQR